MTTWADLQEHARTEYTLQDDEADMLSMVWSYDGDRTQRIVVRRVVLAQREVIEFKSPFARVGQVPPETLLEDNARLLLGTVARTGDVYVVIYNALLQHLVLSEFDYLLARVAAVADTLEEKYVRTDRF